MPRQCEMAHIRVRTKAQPHFEMPAVRDRQLFSAEPRSAQGMGYATALIGLGTVVALIKKVWWASAIGAVLFIVSLYRDQFIAMSSA